eukprot:TRINITY_DN795_c0_g2_i2.p1 TRINITY_DN795_c0_g2~~TRINITY_DN795_c0_g2_i2.p1  ORF type:complete len:849 (+),score=461.54 TRINITY_DN795_c0_g2_i2:51-2597(+)
MGEVIRLKRDEYIHVLDNNANLITAILGPETFTRRDHEKVVAGPEKFVALPPQCFCRVKNPVKRNADGSVVPDEFGQAAVLHGDEEVRVNDGKHWNVPFPLYPGEVLVGGQGSDQPIKKLTVVPKNTALRLRAERDFTDPKTGVERKAGDEWLFEGPKTYIPDEKVAFVAKVAAKVIKANEALRLRAKVNFTDRKGKDRLGGEEWLVREEGAFLPAVEEEVVGTVEAKILTEKRAVEVEAITSHVDEFGTKRCAGERWLVTIEKTSAFIPMVSEKVIRTVPLTTLSNRQYCVVIDPIKNGEQLFGHKEIRRGEGEGTSFFLHPGERLEDDCVHDIEILGADEAILVKALEAFDDNGTKRKPGEKWMLRGPIEYIPPTEVEVVDKRKAVPLDDNEGVYIRNLTTGKVSMITGEAHMLAEDEVLWEKELPPVVEELLQCPKGSRHKVKDEGRTLDVRDKTKAVRFNIPHNAAVQIYDYAGKEPRIVFGPDLVMLQPDESFTVLSLSGDKPKRPHVIQSLQLHLGPAFMTDVCTVETSDHARLELRLSYNWRFKIDKEDTKQAKSVFSVPDFVGDACKAMAGRIRGQVAMESFESFHRNSARIIRSAVFGFDENKRIRDEFKFSANNLVITNVDIQSVEPVDQKTRDSLQKSVQLAIEITTKSQEATARHKAERDAQKASSQLERRKLQDAAEAEKQKKEYLKLQAESEAIEATGQAKAEAKARAEAMLIEANSEVEQARLKADAQKISADAELEMMKSKHKATLEYLQKTNELEIAKTKKLSEIETKKFADTMEAIGPETVLAMARAGPEMQAKLLEGLNLKGYLITDGNSPINLFNTAGGMIGGINSSA